jgi:pimeloyl-ACP methyl ester carboxylesterase
LVLLHGLAVSHRYLMPLAARLADHHPVHVVDLPGFGLSGDPGRVLDVAEHADHLAAWLQAAGLPAVAVLGNSFGCQVAVDLAMRHPDGVGGLVGPTMDPTARTAPRQILRWLGDTAREDPLQLPILVRDVHDAGPRRVVGTLAHALRDPIEDKLPLVRAPMLVTRGSTEPIVPMAWAQAATRLLPLSELAVVPGPHNANYDGADHLAELVLAFLHRRVLDQDGQPGLRVGAPASPSGRGSVHGGRQGAGFGGLWSWWLASHRRPGRRPGHCEGPRPRPFRHGASFMARRSDSAVPSTRHPASCWPWPSAPSPTWSVCSASWSARSRSRASPSMAGHAVSTRTATAVPTDCRHLVAFG